MILAWAFVRFPCKFIVVYVDPIYVFIRSYLCSQCPTLNVWNSLWLTSPPRSPFYSQLYNNVNQWKTAALNFGTYLTNRSYVGVNNLWYWPSNLPLLTYNCPYHRYFSSTEYANNMGWFLIFQCVRLVPGFSIFNLYASFPRNLSLNISLNSCEFLVEVERSQGDSWGYNALFFNSIVFNQSKLCSNWFGAQYNNICIFVSNLFRD